MKKKWIIRIAVALIFFIIAIILFRSLSISHSDAQGIMDHSSIKISNSRVEMIRVTLPNASTATHIRDRVHLMEVTMEYSNKELLLQKIVSNNESETRIVSIGKDFTSGELVGSTWWLSERATAENRSALKLSIVEEALKKLQTFKWRSVSEETIHGQKADKIKSEHHDSIVFLYVDFNTGRPVKMELFNKDSMGNPLKTAERTEEYSYLDQIPFEFLDTKHVVIQQGPAPIQRDIAD